MRRKILDVACAAFMEEGFAATSMSTIAARLGGSKGTLYKYFSSKEELFEETMNDVFQRSLDMIVQDDLPDEDIREFLYVFGCKLLRALFNPIILNLERLVFHEGVRFPEVAKLFYSLGPDAGHRTLADHLEDMDTRGLIHCPNPLLTAHQFLGMVRGDIHIKLLCGLMPIPDAALIDEHVAHAVRLIVPGLLVRRLDAQDPEPRRSRP